MSSSNSPCAACKFLRRKCTQECVFAPNFPPDQPQKFANVHRVFGASNVSKLLNELTAVQREHAVNSLAYEAEARLKDPVYGCVALISILQQKLKQVQTDLVNAKRELATYTSGPSSAQMFGGGVVDVVAQHQQQLQLIEEQQQMLQFNGGFDSSSPNYLYSQFQVQQQHQQNLESLGQLMLLQQPESATPQQQQHEVAFAIPLEQQRQQQQQQQQQHEVAFAIPLDQQRQQLMSNRLEIEQWRLQDDHNEEGGAA